MFGPFQSPAGWNFVLLLLLLFLLLLVLSPSFSSHCSSMPTLDPPILTPSAPQLPQHWLLGGGNTPQKSPRDRQEGWGPPHCRSIPSQSPGESLQGPTDGDTKGWLQETLSCCAPSPYAPLLPLSIIPPNPSSSRLSLGVTQPPLSLSLGALNALLWLLPSFPIMLKGIRGMCLYKQMV